MRQDPVAGVAAPSPPSAMCPRNAKDSRRPAGPGSSDAALLRTEERFRLLVESALDHAILTMDPDGRIDSWSPGASLVFGWNEEEVIGQSIDITFTPEDVAEGVPEKERGIARRDGIAPDVRWHRRKDGSAVFIDGSTRLLRGAAGEVRGYLKIGRNASEERSAATELRELLETRVAERTEELAWANEKLQAEIAERERLEAARNELRLQLNSAEERERLRLSRELHDHMGQLVTALLLGLRSLAGRGEADPAALHDLERLAEQIARELHHVALELRPPALDRLGLRRSLEAHLAEWSERTGIAADFQASGIDRQRFHPEIETTLFRATQEGLTNVAKHAAASSVDLILERRRGTIGIILEDDGQGFDPESPGDPRAGADPLGLLGIRERVTLLRGTFEIESAPGQGTTLFVRLPDHPDRALPAKPEPSR